jgi:adenylosuccinate synthase
LGKDIGSTTHGVGAARVEKIWRSAGNIRLAEEYPQLDDIVSEKRVNELFPQEDYVILEGTQGTLLSMNQSSHYPKTTSQDCIASSFLSSAGLPPTSCRDVWCVFRTYPIRVAGDSGKMFGKEIDFEEIKKRAGFNKKPVEYTSVTKKKRRIFEWSWRDFDTAFRLNNPNELAITFLDYISADDRGVSEYERLSDESKDFIHSVEERAGTKVDIMKTGPKSSHVISRHSQN